jgi:monovalent cation/hydrogen antiporter
MHHSLLLILLLLFAVFMLIMLGQRLRISYPIFLVIAGLGIGFIPGIPHIAIDPELIFLIFLPFLLYEAAWKTSWNDFWKWKRPIALLGFGLVIFSACAVAYLSEWMIPQFTLAIGFLLGGIVSPPDAVAASSVLRDIKVPKRITTILEGESLVNDAASLIVFRFALMAVVSGTFVLSTATVSFFAVTTMGIVIGLIVAHLFYAIHRFFPTTPSMDAALTLLAPYFMYLAAEQFNYSGVMAVVTGGLFLSYRSHELFNHQSRIQAYGVWNTLGFILNGLVFILIGLQLPVIINGLGQYTLSEAINYSLVICALVIVMRIVWTYIFAFLPRLLSKKIRETEPSPGWQGPLVIGWAGMRGVVSLASALAIPLTLSDHTIFPERNLILFITFAVIFVTLVVQGLTLPAIIRFTGLDEVEEAFPSEEQEAGIKLRLMQAALKRLNEHHRSAVAENELVEFLKKQLENDISLFVQKLESLECDETERNEIERYKHVLRDLFKVQREELVLLRKEKYFSDDELRKHEAYLDLDEAKISKTVY